MNLQENINRSLQMMGILTENKKSDIAFRMVNEMGLYDAIRYYGGYERLKQTLDVEIPKDAKIAFIKERVKKVCDETGEDENDGFWVDEINKDPLKYDTEGDIFHQIEIFKPYYAGVYSYEKTDAGIRDLSLGGFLAYYEHMSNDMLDKIIEFIVD